MVIETLTSSQTPAVLLAAAASMNMMSSMGPMPLTMASGAPPGNGLIKVDLEFSFSIPGLFQTWNSNKPGFEKLNSRSEPVFEKLNSRSELALRKKQ